MSWDIGCSRNIFLSLRDKSKVFHVRLHHELKRYSNTVFDAQHFPNLDNLDVESQTSEFKWVIHNGLRRTTETYRSDKQKISISQHRKGIGKNRRLYVTFIQYVQANPASVYVQIRIFCRKESNEFKQVTYVSYNNGKIQGTD